ncbi:hypothetical protein V8D89_009658 [Ganoderma adspersum]
MSASHLASTLYLHNIVAHHTPIHHCQNTYRQLESPEKQDVRLRVRNMVTASYALLIFNANNCIQGHSRGGMHYCYIDTLALINCLPPELLHMVFKEAVALPETVEHVDWRFVLALTHVCRLWRATAIADASLWSHIYLNIGQKCAELFVQRSVGFPLTIHTSLRELGVLDNTLNNHGGRTGAIYINHECHRNEREPIRLLNGFSWSLPRIECFVLNAFVGRGRVDEERHIFVEHMSPLKALRLDGIRLWDCVPTNSFPNLTHLLLYQGSESDDHSRLLAMLATAHRLQYVHLMGLHLTIVPEYYNTTRPLVSLPHIRNLSIHLCDLDIALFLLRHLNLPAECTVCISGADILDNFSNPSSVGTLDIPPLRVLETATSMDLSVWFDGFLVAGHSAPHSTSGFFIETMACLGNWLTWFVETLYTLFPPASITVLHVSILDMERLAQILPPALKHFTRVRELCFLITPRRSRIIPRPPDRTLVELSFGVLLTASSSTESTSDVACPELRILGLEAALAHDAFPFPTIEHIAAARKAAGYPLARFIYHPHMRTHDSAEQRARFAESFVPLAMLVDVVEYRRAADARVCPLKSPSWGCWDMAGAERYWKLPWNFMSYGQDPDLGCEGVEPELTEDGWAEPD